MVRNLLRRLIGAASSRAEQSATKETVARGLVPAGDKPPRYESRARLSGQTEARSQQRDPAGPVSIILWGKPDCCLCDRAREILDRLAREYPMVVEKRDITADPEAFERYRYRIPVVEINGEVRLEGKITEFWLRRALKEGK